MPTKRELIDDVILRVTKGAPSDDLELEPSQVEHWFDLIAGAMVPAYVNNKLKEGGMFSIDPILLEIEDNKVPVKEDVTMLTNNYDRVYITTLKKVMDLKDDAALVRIITDEGTLVDKVALEKLDILNRTTFGRPSRENLLYTRVGTKIYIHGLNSKNVGLIQFSVTYVPSFKFSELDDSDTVTLPDELLTSIADLVEEKASKELYGGVEDLENDAEQDLNVNG
jgi:hypothetical protein